MMEEMSTSNQRQHIEQIIVKYTEENGWERETWYNYYVFDYNSTLIEQFTFLKIFMDIFDECSKKYYGLIVKKNPYDYRTCFSLTMERSANVDDVYMTTFFRKCRSSYKSSVCYLFSGSELPHYREIKNFCEKNDINDTASMKQKLKKVLDHKGRDDDDAYKEFVRAQSLFYKSFGDHEKEYGDAKIMFQSTRRIDDSSDDESDSSDDE
jgi:hypothetical protein